MPRDHVNIETYTIEDIEDETGRKFADLLLQKQAEGVQVNLIYDSLGNYSTPVAFLSACAMAGYRSSNSTRKIHLRPTENGAWPNRITARS